MRPHPTSIMTWGGGVKPLRRLQAGFAHPGPGCV